MFICSSVGLKIMLDACLSGDPKPLDSPPMEAEDPSKIVSYNCAILKQLVEVFLHAQFKCG